jgi:hypothetical protein
VSMWSSKYWDITTATSERTNFTAPATRTLKTEDCVPNTGVSGFDVTVSRFFRRPGQSDLVKQESDFWRYNPADTIICEPPEPPADQGD